MFGDPSNKKIHRTTVHQLPWVDNLAAQLAPALGLVAAGSAAGFGLGKVGRSKKQGGGPRGDLYMKNVVVFYTPPKLQGIDTENDGLENIYVKFQGGTYCKGWM